MNRPKFTKKLQVQGVSPALAGMALPKLGDIMHGRISDIRLARDMYLMLDAMMARGLEIPKNLGVLDINEGDATSAADIAKGLTSIPGFTPGAQTGGRRIGGIPQASGSTIPGGNIGFNDPLAGKGNQHHRSVVVGPGAMPGKGDLVGQDTHYGNGSDSTHKFVWVERNTERSSADGTHTWGSTAYRDYSGNHWRADYHDEHRSDGSIVSKETVFDDHNEPVKTTVREGSPDGTATETTTDHTTGETTTRTGTLPEIFPERSQTGEETGGGSAVAPRGWYNPITGAIQNPGLATGNNQVNPGPDGAAPQPAAQPLTIDSRILVVNPAPDQVVTTGKPRDIRAGDPTIVDPPRPL